MKLKAMHLYNFKGVKEAHYNFFDRTVCKSENGAGKSTIASAHFWIWCNRSYDLTNEPNVRPDNAVESEPRATEIWEINGRDVEVTKYQKRTVSKPDKDNKVEVSFANKYEINSVGKSRRDFDLYFENEGISIKDFLACSHPDVFTNQKSKDMREVILSMASTKSDLEIAQMNDDTAGLAQLLKSYKLEEIEAMNKSTKAAARKRQEEIPSIIQGLEMAKVEVDADNETAKTNIERCEKEISEIDSKGKDAGKEISNLMDKKMKLSFDLSAIMQPMTDKLVADRRNLENEIAKLKSKSKNKQAEKETLAANIVNDNNSIKENNAEVESLRNEYITLKAKEFAGKLNFDEADWVFDESSTVCSLCGQPLPAEKVAELKNTFEERKTSAKAQAELNLKNAEVKFIEDKKTKLKEINLKALDKNNRIKELSAAVEKATATIETLTKEIEDLAKTLKTAEDNLSALPTEVDYTTNADYVAIQNEIESIESEIESLNSADDKTAEYESKKKELREEIAYWNEVVFKNQLNADSDKKIDELTAEKKEKEQVVTNAQNILEQINKLSKLKNELLVDEINSHFKIVKWKLFDYQKNGEYKDVCIPTVDGKIFEDTANRARDIQAKLDICDSLQKFKNMSLPVFLDNAESVNDKNIPNTDCQLIVFKVTEDSELKIEEMK